MRQPRSGEDVEPHDSPAECLELIVGLKPLLMMASAAISGTRSIGVPRFRAPTIEDDFDGGVVQKRPLDVVVEFVSVPRNDQELLDDWRTCVLTVLGLLRQAARKRLEPGQRLVCSVAPRNVRRTQGMTKFRFRNMSRNRDITPNGEAADGSMS